MSCTGMSQWVTPSCGAARGARPDVSFVHLHTHSEYSLLDGASRLGDLVRKAKEFEMPALGLTDHGCMYGAWAFQKLARSEGIKPIVGMEAYVAPGDRRNRTRRGPSPYHLVLLARDAVGYRNLVKLSSLAYTEGFYYRPRVDRESLARHSEGLIVTSACMAGEVARHLTAGDEERAVEAASWYANAFPDRYYLEVQAHGTPGQDTLNEQVFSLAARLGLPVVATNDAHFLEHGHHKAHDILVCIGTAKNTDDPDRLVYDDGLYLKNAQEILDAFPDRPEVLDNTLKIADEVSLEFKKTYHLPSFPLPDRFSDDNDYLVHLATTGAKKRYGAPLPEEVKKRLDDELAVILKTGYAGYFLITWDFIRWARDQGIPVGPGRGSAAGSLISYALRITDLDPIHYDLLFERFLNPERISMPDIDIDFCYERRGEVIEYVREKYGRRAVGQIVTFGTMKSRAVIRDVGRVLGFDIGETDRIAKMIPNQPGKSYTVAEAISGIQDVAALYASDERHKQLFDYSTTLEGLSRHASVHAAGVVIAPGPLDDYVPICTPSKGVRNGAQRAPRDGDAPDIVTQYDMNALEDAGMLKMDFLGLKTLTVIHDAVAAIRARAGGLRHPKTGAVYESPSMDDVPLDDAQVYEMLAGGGTSGVFQFESQLAMDKLRAMRCDRFDDLVATNALIRPGPLDSGMTDQYIARKLGHRKVVYPAPGLEHILEPTYGIIVYQEQVMRIASDLAGYSLGEADVLRKAMGKKDAALIESELGRFQERLTGEKGLSKRAARRLAKQIETFGRYGFNKSHSAAYSLLSYKTAWLKRHYPAEFMAALLSSVLEKTDDVVKYIGECRELGRYHPELADGLKVLPPDVNESGWKFTAVDPHTIRFGLGAVRGLGSGAFESILEARNQGGAFTGYFEFVNRVDPRAINKRACQALIHSGALDSFGHRAQLEEGLDLIHGEASARVEESERGQQSLFGGEGVERPDPELPDVERWRGSVQLAHEKNALGFFISGHPLDPYRDIVGVFDQLDPASLKERMGQTVETACVVTAVARQVSRKDGSEWAKLTVEGFQGTVTVLAFREVWQSHKELLQPDALVLLSGKVSNRERDEEAPPVFLDAAEALGDVADSGRVALQIRLDANGALPGGAPGDIKSVVQEHAGGAPLEFLLSDANGTPARRLRSRTLTVSVRSDVVGALDEVVGKGAARLVRV